MSSLVSSATFNHLLVSLSVHRTFVSNIWPLIFVFSIVALRLRGISEGLLMWPFIFIISIDEKCTFRFSISLYHLPFQYFWHSESNWKFAAVLVIVEHQSGWGHFHHKQSFPGARINYQTQLSFLLHTENKTKEESRFLFFSLPL